MKHSLWLGLVASLMIAMVAGRSHAAEKPKVNYVSADAIYLNVGRLAGLIKGSRVRVVRNGKRIAILEVVHVSSHSASCIVVEGSGTPRSGDFVHYDPVKVTRPAKTAIPKRPAALRTRVKHPEKHKNAVNRLSGFMSVENYWDQDLTGSSLTSIQPAISARIIVSNFLGTGGELKIRHRSRLYYRPGATTDASRSVWSHRLTEAAIRFGGSSGGTRVGLGRMVISDMYGLGFVDGAYISRQVNARYRVGVAGGLDANAAGGSIHSNRQKVGAYVTYERALHDNHRVSLTGAVAGSYASGLISREFAYMQGIYTVGRLFYIYQSVEIDVNRKWRRSANGGVVSFSNYVLSANSSPLSFLSLDFNYDARHNTRDAYNRATPDTLFDSDVYTGFGGGATLSLPGGIRLRGSAGLRLRGVSEQLNRYYTVSADMWGLLPRGHGLSLRWSVSETPFVTGYRPTLSYRFPISRFLRATAGGGAYIFDQGPVITRTYYAQGAVNWSIGQRYFVAVDVRQNIGGGVDASQIFAESGINF